MYTNWQQPGGYANQMQPAQFGQPDPNANAMYQQPQAYQQWYNYAQTAAPPGHMPGTVGGQPPLPSEQSQPPLPADLHGIVPPPLPNGAPPLPNTAPPAPSIDPPQPPQDVKPPLPPEPPPDDDSKKDLEPKTAEEVNKLTALQQQALQWQTINQHQPATWQPPQWPQSGYGQQPPPPTAAPPPPGQLNQEWQALLNEEGEFIVQYEQWRKQYDDWKDQNKNHPNQEQFKQYESQWKQYEQQMEEKQAYIQNRKIQLQSQMAAAHIPPPPQPQAQPVNYGHGAPPMPPNLSGPGPVPNFNAPAPPPVGGPGMQGFPPLPSSNGNMGQGQFPPPPSSVGGTGQIQFQPSNAGQAPSIPPLMQVAVSTPTQLPPASSSSGMMGPGQHPPESISSAQQNQFHPHSESSTNRPLSRNQSQATYPPNGQQQSHFQAQSDASNSTAQVSQSKFSDTPSQPLEQDEVNSKDSNQIPGFGEFPPMDKSEDTSSQIPSSQSAASRLGKSDNFSQGQNTSYFDTPRSSDNFQQEHSTAYSNRGFSDNDNINFSGSHNSQSESDKQNMSQYSFSQMHSDVKTSSQNKRTNDERYQNRGFDESGSVSNNQGYRGHSQPEKFEQDWDSQDGYYEHKDFGSRGIDSQTSNRDMMEQQRFRGPRPPFHGRFEGGTPFPPQGSRGSNPPPFRGPPPPIGHQRPGLLGAGPAGDYNAKETKDQYNFSNTEESDKFYNESERKENEFDDDKKYYPSDNMEDGNRFADNNMPFGLQGGPVSRFGGPRIPFDGPRGSRFDQPTRGRGFGFRGARFPGPRFDSPYAPAYDDHSQESFQEKNYEESEYDDQFGQTSGRDDSSRSSGGPGDKKYGLENKPSNFPNSQGMQAEPRPPHTSRGNVPDFEEPVTKMSKYDKEFGKNSDYPSTEFSGSRAGQSDFGMSGGQVSNFGNTDEFDNSVNPMSRFDNRPGNISRISNMQESSEFNYSRGQSKFGMQDQMSDLDRGFNMDSEFDSQMTINQSRFGDVPGNQQKPKSAVPSLLDLDFRQPPPSLMANWKKDQTQSDDDSASTKNKTAADKKDEEVDAMADKNVKEEEADDKIKEDVSLASNSTSKSLIDDVKLLQKQQQTLQNLQKLEEVAEKEAFYSEDDIRKESTGDDLYQDENYNDFGPESRPPFHPGGRFPRGAGAGLMRPSPEQMRAPGPGQMRAPGHSMMRPGSRFPPPQRGAPFGSQMISRPPFDRMRGPRPMNQRGRGAHNFQGSYDAEEDMPMPEEDEWNESTDPNLPFSPERGRGVGRARGIDRGRARGRARGRGGDHFSMENEMEFTPEEELNRFPRERRMDPWNKRFEQDDGFRPPDQFEEEAFPGPRRVPPHDYPGREFPGRDFPVRDFPERDFPDREYPDREYVDSFERRPDFPPRRDPFFDRDRFGPPMGPDFERRRGFEESARRGLDDYRDDFREREFSPHRDRSMMDRPPYDDRSHWERQRMDDRHPYDRPPHDRFPPDMPFRERHLLERSRLDSPRPGDRLFETKELIDYGHKPQSLDNEKESQPYTAPEVIDYGHGQRDVNKSVDDFERRQRPEKYSRDSGRRDDTGRRDDRDRGRGGERYDSPRDGKRPPLFPHETRDKFSSKPEEQKIETVKVEDLIYKPGRNNRPQHMVFIMRGLPGAGKTYVSKLIREKEIANGGHAPRMLCLDDYFMVEIEKKEKDPETGKMVTRKILDYEYEPEIEDAYRQSLLKSFKKTVDGGLYPFIIFDAVNDRVKHFEEFWSYAKSKGFQVYVAEIQADVSICSKRNTHKRSYKEVDKIKKRFEDTPKHYLRLDTRGLLQEVSITEVEMEDSANDDMKKNEDNTQKEDDNNGEEEDGNGGFTIKKSKWELETSGEQLDKLDGIRHAKRRRSGDTQTFEDFLQLADESLSRDSAEPGRKRVRWADIEERKDQLRRRDIGFVVGQTQRDWERITDNTYAERALNKTKYI